MIQENIERLKYYYLVLKNMDNTTLQDYLGSIYEGTQLDVKQQSKQSLATDSILSRIDGFKSKLINYVMDKIDPPDLVVKVFAKLQQQAEQNERESIGSMLEHFRIENLTSQPNEIIVRDQILLYLKEQGYNFSNNVTVYEGGRAISKILLDNDTMPDLFMFYQITQDSIEVELKSG